MGNILFNKKQIDEKLAVIAKEIYKDYANIKENLCVIAVANGASIFAADLIRKIPLDFKFQTIIASSYNGKTSSQGNEVEVLGLNEALIKNHNILIIDDILDTGKTITKLENLTLEMDALSVKTCTLLKRKGSNLTPHYYGFEVDKGLFVWGYGLDKEGYLGRNCGDIMI